MCGGTCDSHHLEGRVSTLVMVGGGVRDRKSKSATEVAHRRLSKLVRHRSDQNPCCGGVLALRCGARRFASLYRPPFIEIILRKPVGPLRLGQTRNNRWVEGAVGCTRVSKRCSIDIWRAVRPSFRAFLRA